MTLPSAGSGYTPWSLAVRLAFSRDRRSLLSIPTERGKGATVWDVAAREAHPDIRGRLRGGSLLPGWPPGHRDDGTGGRRARRRDGCDRRAMADAGWPGLRPGEDPESLLPPQCLPRRRAEPVREPRRPLGGGLRAAPWERYRHADGDLPLRRRIGAAARRIADARGPGRQPRERPGPSAGVRPPGPRARGGDRPESLHLLGSRGPAAQRGGDGRARSHASWSGPSGWRHAGLRDAHRPRVRAGRHATVPGRAPVQCVRLRLPRNEAGRRTQGAGRTRRAGRSSLGCGPAEARRRGAPPRRARPGRQVRAARAASSRPGATIARSASGTEGAAFAGLSAISRRMFRPPRVWDGRDGPCRGGSAASIRRVPCSSRDSPTASSSGMPPPASAEGHSMASWP